MANNIDIEAIAKKYGATSVDPTKVKGLSEKYKATTVEKPSSLGKKVKSQQQLQQELQMAQAESARAKEVESNPWLQLGIALSENPITKLGEKASPIMTGYGQGLIQQAQDTANFVQGVGSSVTGLKPTYLDIPGLEPQGPGAGTAKFVGYWTTPGGLARGGIKALQVAQKTSRVGLRKAAEMFTEKMTDSVGKAEALAKGTVDMGVKRVKTLLGERIVAEPAQRAVQIAKSLGKYVVKDAVQTIDNIRTAQRGLNATIEGELKRADLITKKDVDSIKKMIDGMIPDSYFARSDKQLKTSAESIKSWVKDELDKAFKAGQINSKDALWKWRALMDDLSDIQTKSGSWEANTAGEIMYSNIRRKINEWIGKDVKIAGQKFTDLMKLEHDMFDGLKRLGKKYAPTVQQPGIPTKPVTMQQRMKQAQPLMIAGGAGAAGVLGLNAIKNWLFGGNK